MAGGAQLCEQRSEQTRIERNRTELPSEITDGSRADLTVDCDVARAIGDTDAQPQLIWADTLHNGFTLPSIIQVFERSNEALPDVARDPTRSGANEPVAREPDLQADVATG
jgi:hypothetical protein